MPTPMATAPDNAPRGVLPDEWPMFVAMGAFAFLSVALAILVRTWSDAVFIAHFPASWLSLFFIVSAFAFAPTTIAYAALARRVALVRLNTGALGLFAIVALACVGASGKWSVFAAALVLAIVSPLTNVAAWSTILERLDSRQARRLIPLIGGVGTAGAVGGGSLGAWLVETWGTGALLWAVVAVLVVMLPFPRWVTGDQPDRPTQRPADPGFAEGWRALGKNRLLRVVGAATFLMAVGTNLTDYLLKARLQVELAPDQIALFFAWFHSLTNVAVLAFQFLVVAPAVHRLGISRSFSAHPAVVLGGALLCVVSPSLVAAVALRASDTLLKFTFHSSTQDLVVTPVPQVERTQAKVFLKGIVYPLGGLTAGLLIPLVAVAGWWAAPALVAALTALWLRVARQAGAAHRAQLEANLLVKVQPGLTGEPTSPDVLREVIRAHLSVLATPCARPTRPDEVQQHLSDTFEALGALLGDTRAIAETARRYLEGDPHQRADAVELLDALFRELGFHDAGAILDALLRATPIPQAA